MAEPDTRTPVYFVHGYNSAGAEHDLAAYMRALDPAKYRVVPYDYDYTQRLGKSAQDLASKIKAEGRPVHVLAHSMGGLVSLGAVKALKEAGTVRSVTTVASPFNGHKGAAFGVYLSPFSRREVLKDMIPGSAYQKSIAGPNPGTKHFAVLADKDGEGDDDGTISLRSQTKRQVLNNATRITPSRNTHTSVLQDEKVIQQWATDLQNEDAPVLVAGTRHAEK